MKNSILEELQESLHPLREQLIKHEVYTCIKTLEDLQIFMEHHVFAVWDFMSLLKALQRHLTCITLPWVPQGDQLSRRFINEIVLAEESGENIRGRYMSHFELYRDAMTQCRANTSSIDKFLSCIQRGESVSTSLQSANAPKASQVFVETTWGIIESGAVHSVAAAFTLGREGLIPDMFRALVANLQRQFPEELDLFQDYLERHIHLDEEQHSPMASQMLKELCSEEYSKWKEAEQAARISLNARTSLWNSVVEEIAFARNRNKYKVREVNTISLLRT